MATVQNSLLLQGIRGMFGNSIVFRNVQGKTILSQRPAPAATQSELQRVNRSKFRDASEWAKQILKDPLKKEYYLKKARKLKLPNAYTAAITDYMRKATLVKCKTSKDEVTYNVSKKQFALKKVELVMTQQGATIIRDGLKVDDVEWELKLTNDELLKQPYLRITDNAGRVMLMEIE